MEYIGTIIEESLIDNSIFEKLNVIQTSVENISQRESTPWLDKWTLKTVSISEENIDEYCQQISKLIDPDHYNSWYCDFRNDKFHYVVFKDKVFKLIKNRKQDYENMKEYGMNLGIPENQLPTYNDLPINLLIGFLIYAKKQTYANSNAKKELASRLGSKDYHFEEKIEGEIMKYHDTYFGGIRFMGQEVVYRGSDIPKWGMSYYGITIDETLSEEAMDKVLRPALMKVGEDNTVLPVRGTSKFENDGYIYTFKSNGKIDNFTGVEEIYKENKLIYRLQCHGGFID